jgi:hypothetical protein
LRDTVVLMKRNRGMTMFNILLVLSFPSDLIAKGRCIGSAEINGLNGDVKNTVLVVIQYLCRRESPAPDFEYSQDDPS